MTVEPRQGLGARAHCDRHSPGQRHNLESLVAWQSRSAGRYFSADAQRETGTSAAGPTGTPAAPLRTSGDAARVQRLTLTALSWLPADLGDDPCTLGSLQLWALLPEDAEWLDLTLSVHRQGRWWRLHPELLDAAADASALPRLLLVLPEDEIQALAAQGVAMSELRRAASQAETACWCSRADGLGSFVAGLVDLGWPLPSPP